MSKQQRLARHITVGGATYGPDDEVPPEVMEKITNPKAFVPVDEDAEPVDFGREAGTASGHKLASTVHIDGYTFGPNDPVPDHIARKIKNPKAWEGGKLPHFAEVEDDTSASGGEHKVPAKKAAAPAAARRDA